MSKTEYIEDGLYQVEIDTTQGSVTLGGYKFIIDSEREASIFERAYLMGREHKKSQITKILGLWKN